jgi:hypothetical protein
LSTTWCGVGLGTFRVVVYIAWYVVFLAASSLTVRTFLWITALIIKPSAFCIHVFLRTKLLGRAERRTYHRRAVFIVSAKPIRFVQLIRRETKKRARAVSCVVTGPPSRWSGSRVWRWQGLSLLAQLLRRLGLSPHRQGPLLTAIRLPAAYGARLWTELSPASATVSRRHLVCLSAQ